MENHPPMSTMKCDYLSPSTDHPIFMGSAPPVGLKMQRSMHRYFRRAGVRLLKEYHNEKIQMVMAPNYNRNLVRSSYTSDAMEDLRCTAKKHRVECFTPKVVMPRLYPAGDGKRMEDFATIFNEQRAYFRDYTTEAPRYRYFSTGGHPFTQQSPNLLDYSSTYPRQYQPAEKGFTMKSVERHGPRFQGDVNLAGKRNKNTTAYKW